MKPSVEIPIIAGREWTFSHGEKNVNEISDEISREVAAFAPDYFSHDGHLRIERVSLGFLKRGVKVSLFTVKQSILNKSDPYLFDVPFECSPKTIAGIFRKSSFKKLMDAFLQDFSDEQIIDKDLVWKLECDLGDLCEPKNYLNPEDVVDSGIFDLDDSEVLFKKGYLSYAKKLMRETGSDCFCAFTAEQLLPLIADTVDEDIAQDREFYLKERDNAAEVDKDGYVKTLAQLDVAQKKADDCRSGVGLFQRKVAESNDASVIPSKSEGDEVRRCREAMEEAMDLDEAQARRFERSGEAACSPDFVDKEGRKAVFPSSGGKSYDTSLISCSCVDFAKNKGMPCKHMYRLAMELGVLDCDFKSGLNKNKAKKIPESGYDGLTMGAKRILMEILFAYTTDENSFFLLPRSNEAEELIRHGFCNEFIGRYSEVCMTSHRGLLIHSINRAAFSDVKSLKPGTQFRSLVNLVSTLEDNDVDLLKSRIVALELSEMAKQQGNSIYKRLCVLFYEKNDRGRLHRLNDFLAHGLITQRRYETSLSYLENDEACNTSVSLVDSAEFLEIDDDALPEKETDSGNDDCYPVQDVTQTRETSIPIIDKPTAKIASALSTSVNPVKRPVETFCIVSFILSLLGLLLFWLVIPILCSFAGLIFGILGIFAMRKKGRRGMSLSIWGMALSIITIILFICILSQIEQSR